MSEAQQRPDLGVGSVWKPKVGGGIRPSSIFAENVLSLATADLEMQSSAHANPRVRSATHHEVFSFGNDPDITDEQALEAVRLVYERVGLGRAQKVLAVHRDTDKVHVHSARSAVDPTTLRAFDLQMIHTRLDRAARHVELEMGLAHDRGLAVVDAGPSGVALVRDSTKAERVAWARENGEERLAALERVRYADNEKREGYSFERWAEARVEPRLRSLLRAASEADVAVQPIDLLNKAARHGCRIQVEGLGDESYSVLRDVSVGRLRETQRAQLEAAADRLKEEHANGLQRDEALTALRDVHRQELLAEMRRLEREGDVISLSPRMQAELTEALRDVAGGLTSLGDTERAKELFRLTVAGDPGYVVRALTQTSSTFTRDDVDRFLVERLDDVGDIENLAQKVFTDVGELVLLSPDIADGVWTTHEMLEIDEAIADDAAALAARPDPHFDADRRRQAITQLEADRTAQKGEPFRLSAEQRAALSHNGGLTVLLGKPGVGKTTIMETLRREADVIGRKIHGITVAQAAAIRLEVAAGFRCVNSAFALVGDHPRRELIPRDGILVLDEAPMMDNRTVRAIVALARERNTVVVALGDHRQIQSIGPGGAWHILAAAAQRAGTFSELNEIRPTDAPVASRRGQSRRRRDRNEAGAHVRNGS